MKDSNRDSQSLLKSVFAAGSLFGLLNCIWSVELMSSCIWSVELMSSCRFPIWSVELVVQFRHLLPQLGGPQLQEDVVNKDANECYGDRGVPNSKLISSCMRD